MSREPSLPTYSLLHARRVPKVASQQCNREVMVSSVCGLLEGVWDPSSSTGGRPRGKVDRQVGDGPRARVSRRPEPQLAGQRRHPQFSDIVVPSSRARHRCSQQQAGGREAWSLAAALLVIAQDDHDSRVAGGGFLFDVAGDADLTLSAVNRCNCGQREFTLRVMSVKRLARRTIGACATSIADIR